MQQSAEAIPYIAAGAAGFLFLVLYDLSQVRGRNGIVRAITAPAGYGLVTAALTLAALHTPPPAVSDPLAWLPIGAAVFWGALEVYSVFVEIPLHRKRRTDSAGRLLYDTGTYGIVRHPGFLWFFLMNLSLALFFLNRAFSLIAASLVALDFLLVLLEDTLVFPRIFSGYHRYRKTVPFLIPRFSFRRTATTARSRRGDGPRG